MMSIVAIDVATQINLVNPLGPGVSPFGPAGCSRDSRSER